MKNLVTNKLLPFAETDLGKAVLLIIGIIALLITGAMFVLFPTYAHSNYSYLIITLFVISLASAIASIGLATKDID